MAERTPDSDFNNYSVCDMKVKRSPAFFFQVGDSSHASTPKSLP
jgi:hypothetical protein